MDRILTNLFNNALQAMPQGGILTIDASKTCHQIILTIADTGVGISPEILPRIFQPLMTTKSKGMGIGLVVCKRLLEAQGAEIKIESEPGLGTVVIIKITS
jgi:signal transduction histidine kinase